jgi:hypothetical protein
MSFSVHAADVKKYLIVMISSMFCSQDKNNLNSLIQLVFVACCFVLSLYLDFFKKKYFSS